MDGAPNQRVVHDGIAVDQDVAEPDDLPEVRDPGGDVGSKLVELFRASPMISSWRSTAECNNSLRANSSLVLSRTNAAM